MITKSVAFLFLAVTVTLVGISVAAALAERETRTVYRTQELEAALTETIEHAASRVQQQEAAVDALLERAHRAVGEAADDFRSLGGSDLQHRVRPDLETDRTAAGEQQSAPRDQR